MAVHAGHLNQVWMNVLANALDALEGRRDPELRITVGVRAMSRLLLGLLAA